MDSQFILYIYWVACVVWPTSLQPYAMWHYTNRKRLNHIQYGYKENEWNNKHGSDLSL